MSGLLGSGSKGRQGGNIQGAAGAIGTANPDHSHGGNPDVVAQRKNATLASGKMQHDQLKKNKSTGIKP
jgi:hypothetical protein